MLYASAPAEFNGGVDLMSSIYQVAISMFWMIVYWIYLNKPHVKTFLRVEATKKMIEGENTKIIVEKT